MSLNSRSDFTTGAHNTAGDGSTDDTTNLQFQVAYVSAGGTAPNQQLYVPFGTYKITTGITVSASSLNIRGDGPNATVFWMSNTGATTGAFTTTGGSQLTDIVFENCGFTADPSNRNGYGFLINNTNGATRVKFINCKFSGFLNCGIRAAQAMDSFIIDRCEFTANNLAAYGASVTAGGDINGHMQNGLIQNCYIHDTGNTGNVDGPSHGIYINTSTWNVMIQGCLFESVNLSDLALGTSGGVTSSQYGISAVGNVHVLGTGAGNGRIQVSAVEGCVLANNTMYCPAAGAIQLSNDVTNFSVTGNTIVGEGASGTSGMGGISVGASCNGGVISGNTLSAPDTKFVFGQGITVSGTDVAIVGNHISGYYQPVVLFAGSSYVDIRDNLFRIQDGATDITLGGRGSLGPNTYAGITVLGSSNEIFVAGNRIRNFIYGVILGNFQSQTGNPTNVVVERNRFSGLTTAAVFINSGTTATNVRVDSNLGDNRIVNSGSATNLKAFNNAVDGSFWSTPGTPNNVTTL